MTSANKIPEENTIYNTQPAVLNEIIWLMSQSPNHRYLFIGDLEWALLPAYSSQQFRIFHKEGNPVAFISWAMVSEKVLERCKQSGPRLKPEDWQSGSIPLVIDLITPFGGGEDLLKELKGKLFADVPVMVFARGKDGERFGLVRVGS